jgi:hypothetical protein
VNGCNPDDLFDLSIEGGDGSVYLYGSEGEQDEFDDDTGFYDYGSTQEPESEQEPERESFSDSDDYDPDDEPF